MPRSTSSIVRIVGGTSSSSPKTFEAVSTIPELIAAVPAPYREVLKPVINAHFSVWRKLNSCRAYISKLEQHHRNQTFPPEIDGAFRVPTLQFSKEALEDSAVKVAYEGSLTTLVFQAKRNALSASLKAKNTELSLLQSRVTEETCQKDLFDAMKPVVADFMKDFGFKIAGETLEILGISPAPSPFAEEHTFLLNHGIKLLQRLGVIAHMAHDRDLASKMKSLSLVKKATTDVVMGGISDSLTTSDIQSAIREGLNSFAKEYKLSKPMGKKAPKRLTNTTKSKKGKSSTSKDGKKGKRKQAGGRKATNSNVSK
ncbi:hypothetical protein EX30DRAFT_399491 [Ascodesmis nigricans]|uniref:Uncharacterized protein n=1 Tax=Ascodesmis nigricans TaxID=341454 RepID=A0A4S2MH14_9PEZI|nr:hypothetical protein EX30DRAFT_399491 [Ascodesmis nigricans]